MYFFVETSLRISKSYLQGLISLSLSFLGCLGDKIGDSDNNYLTGCLCGNRDASICEHSGLTSAVFFLIRFKVNT